MLFTGKRARRRAQELFRTVYASPQPPLAEMEELIDLGRKHPPVKQLVLEQLAGLLESGGDDRGLCWLLIMAGELGREGVLAVLFGTGRGDDPEALYRVIVPVLSRHASEVLPVLLRLIHQSEGVLARRALYRAAEGALLSPTGHLRTRLAVFALERFYAELEDPEARDALGVYPLRLLRQADEGKFREVYARLEVESRESTADFEGLKEKLLGGEYMDDARSYAAQDWRELARSL